MTSAQQACQDPEGCALTMNLSWVPGAALVLCVFHKRRYEAAHGEQRSQGELSCPHCKQTFSIQSARGQRARAAARRQAEARFQRHVATCATRQTISRNLDIER